MSFSIRSLHSWMRLRIISITQKRGGSLCVLPPEFPILVERSFYLRDTATAVPSATTAMTITSASTLWAKFLMKAGLCHRLGISVPTIAPEPMATAMRVLSEVIYAPTADGPASRIVVNIRAPVSETTTDAAPQPVVNRLSVHGCR